MLEAVGWMAVGLAGLLIGSVMGKILVRLRGERWRNSIRGLMFATTLVAIAVYLLVSNWHK
jgi:hypothetical protein